MRTSRASSPIQKIPVAAYARVSTEKEEQKDSFERQVAHYTAYIQTRNEWEFVEVYADPGISGTKAAARPNFMRMIEDCRAGKIKKILVKSISRFARNTVDALVSTHSAACWYVGSVIINYEDMCGQSAAEKGLRHGAVPIA